MDGRTDVIYTLKRASSGVTNKTLLLTIYISVVSLNYLLLVMLAKCSKWLNTNAAQWCGNIWIEIEGLRVFFFVGFCVFVRTCLYLNECLCAHVRTRVFDCACVGMRVHVCMSVIVRMCVFSPRRVCLPVRLCVCASASACACVCVAKTRLEII